MWIAKNSITGKTYGNKYRSIYSCQSFIDKSLCVLEYEMQRCFALEKDVIESLKDKDIFTILSDGINAFAQESGIQDDLKCIIEMSFQGKKQQEIDIALHKLAMSRWQKNNVIRCWNIEQKRFADGFDF